MEKTEAFFFLIFYNSIKLIQVIFNHLNDISTIKEARGGCGLNNRLCDFFYFLHMQYSWYSEYIYVKKTYLTVTVVIRGRSQNMRLI